MHIDQMRYFLQIVESGSVNAAAQKFFISQQAMNASLKKMEEELNTSLVERSRKGITLTPQGRIFAAHVKTIVEQYAEAIVEIRQIDAEEKKIAGNLTILASSIFTDLFLPDVVCDFLKIYPNINIKIIESHDKEIFATLLCDVAELALCSINKTYLEHILTKEKYQQIEQIPLLDDTIVACVYPNHPLMRYKKIDYGELNATSVGNKALTSLYYIVPDATQKLDSDILVSTSDNPEVHKKLMREGNAITSMPQLAYQYLFKKDGFYGIPVEKTQTVRHCLLYKNDPQAANYKLQQIFLKYICSYFARVFGAYNPTHE